jgi:hypothetical protein
MGANRIGKLTTFRRAFIDHGAVCVEVSPGKIWYLPNPATAADLRRGPRSYDPVKILKAIVTAGQINLELWKRIR